MPFVAGTDVEQYFEEHGAGSPLLLLAGLASDSQSWQAILGPLAAKYRVILPDNRGCGRTRTRQGEVRLEQMAGDVLRLLDHLGLEQAALLGHSMGGLIALAVAQSHPERVSALLLAATPGSLSGRNRALLRDWATWAAEGVPDRQRYHHLFYWLFGEAFFEEERLVELAEEYAATYPYRQSSEGFRAQVEALLACRLPDLRPAWGVRTLIMAGENDLLFPPARCRELGERLEGATFVCLAGAAHALHVEQPERFVREVCAFLG